MEFHVKHISRVLAAVIFAIGVSACTLSLPTSNNQVAGVYSAYGIALSAAVAYRNRPLCKTGETTTLSNICAERHVVVAIQSADRQAQGALTAMANFVKNNPTLDASNVIIAAQQAVADFNKVESTYGVQ